MVIRTYIALIMLLLVVLLVKAAQGAPCGAGGLGDYNHPYRPSDDPLVDAMRRHTYEYENNVTLPERPMTQSPEEKLESQMHRELERQSKPKPTTAHERLIRGLELARDRARDNDRPEDSEVLSRAIDKLGKLERARVRLQDRLHEANDLLSDLRDDAMNMAHKLGYEEPY
jgi:hypothetical protein